MKNYDKPFPYNIIRMILRYGIFDTSSQQWSIGIDLYENISELFDISFETFASPLNFNMYRFCSIFYDTDNTAYYIDGASGSKLKYLQIDGDWGSSPFGSGHESFTIRSTYASMVQRQTNGGLGYWLHHIASDAAYYLYGGKGATDGSSWDWSYKAYPNQDGSYVEFRTSARAPLFYDSNNTAYYLDPASTSNLNALTVAGGNATIYRDLIVNGGGSGNFGNRIIVQGTATTYTYQDTTLRPTVYLNGDYPVLTLNATATTNANHGPTLQFAFNGLTTGGATSRQIVIGANGVGSWLDFGFSGFSSIEIAIFLVESSSTTPYLSGSLTW